MTKATWFRVLAVIVCSLQGTTPWAAQKPVKEAYMEIDRLRVPATLAELAGEVQAIIVATYTGASHRVVGGKGYGVMIPATTAYAFKIVDIVKLHQYLPFAGNELQLDLPGSDEEFPTYILRSRERGATPLVPSRTYVLFLNWNPYIDKFVVYLGSAGIYDVTDGRVTSINTDGQHFDGTSAPAFVGALRAAAK